MVTATLNDEQLGFRVPLTISDKIRVNSSSSAEYRERVIDYYIQFSPHATWSGLAEQLYANEYTEALAAAKRFIKRTPGKCVYTL